MAPRKDATKKPDKAKAAADFEKIINEGRERKRNQELAANIFSSNRRKSAPTGPKLGGGSLASRVGIKKQRASIGNVGEWTHDLHGTRSKAPAGSLAARITAPGANPPGKAAQKRAAKLASGLSRVDPSQVNIRAGPPPTGPKAMRLGETNGSRNGRAGGAKQPQQKQRQQVKQEEPVGPEISIRGLAGPYSVLVQNLAPGTTAADIESAMTPVAGEMVDCRVLKTQPIMLAEMVFVSREAGEKVIQLFNNQKADGRILKVYPNPSGYTPRPAPSDNRRPAMAESRVVDGKMGFPEPGTTAVADYGSSPYASPGAGPGTGGLYSDRMVGVERRGRGFRGDRSRD